MNQTVTVLVIEDDQDIVKLFQDFSEHEWNLKVLSAITLKEGLEVFAKEGADALLVDLRLPDCEGIETCLRVQEAVNGTPFLIFTGMGNPELEDECIKAGAGGFLYKGSVTIDMALKALIRAAIREQERQNYLSLTAEEQQKFQDLQIKLIEMAQRYKAEFDDLYRAFSETARSMRVSLSSLKT